MDMMVGEEREDRVSSSSGSKRGRHDNEQDGGNRKADDKELDDENAEEGPRDKADAVKVKSRRSLSGREKAEKIRRQRNCENARKARLRKKMEVTQLQEKAAELKLENARSKEEARKAREAKARAENQRRQALRTFMRYRCSNVKSYEKWLAVVEETFTLTLPITPYRWFSGGDVVNSSRVVRGIQHLMTDNGSLAVLIESLGCGTLPWRKEMEKGSGHGVELVCDIGDDDMIMTGDSMMCCLLLRTTNAVKHGAKSEWLCRGMMSAKFSQGSSKLAAAELMFDVTSLMQRLQKVVGEDQGMPVVPNTPMGACQPSQEMRVITMAKPPFAVVSCNDSWTKLSGYNQDDVKGRPFSILEGPHTDATALTTLKTEIQSGRAASSLVLNYKRDGSSFLNYLRVYPLIGDSLGTVTHFLGVSQEQPEDPESESTSEATAPIRRDVAHRSSNSSTKVEWPGAAAPSNSLRRCEDTPESPAASVTSPTAVASPAVASLVLSSVASATTGLSVALTSVSSSSSCSSSSSSAFPAPSRGLEYRSEPAIFASICSRPGSMATGDGAVVGGSRKSSSKFPFSSQAGVAASTGSSIFVGGLGSRGAGAVDASVATGDTAVSIGEELRDSCSGGDTKASARVCLTGGSFTEPRTSSGARSGLDRQPSTRGLSASDGGKKVGTEVKVSPGRLELPRIQVSCEKQRKNVPTMDEASERRWGCRTARNGLQKAPVQMLGGDEANDRGGGVDGALAARIRSQQAQSLGDTAHQVVADDDVNSLCSPFERQSTGSEDSPGPFLAWEDVLAGPGDPLQELGAAHMQEELEEAGVRVTKQGTTGGLRYGATPNDRAGSERTGRHRAVSESIAAGGWQVEVAPARDLNSNRRQVGSSAGLITGCSSSVSGPPLDVGERVTRSVSDSAVWDCSRSVMSNASNKIGLNLSRTGGSSADSMSTAGLERGLGNLADAESGQGPSGYLGLFGSSSGVETAESGGLLPMDDNHELMLTQEALFRSAATVMTDGSSWAIDPGGTPVANSNNVTLPMFSLMDPAAMGAVPYNFVGFNNATTTGAGDWRPSGGLPGETGGPGVALLGGVGGITVPASDGKGISSTPDQDMTQGKDASALMEFQMASSWPPLMDPNVYRAAGGIVRSGLQGEGKAVLEQRHQQQLGSTVINISDGGGSSNAPSPGTDPTMASGEMTKQQAPK